jgi:hypothetical protein
VLRINPKQYQNPNFKCSKNFVLNFIFLSFEFVSYFVLRISYFVSATRPGLEPGTWAPKAHVLPITPSGNTIDYFVFLFNNQ